MEKARKKTREKPAIAIPNTSIWCLESPSSFPSNRLVTRLTLPVTRRECSGHLPHLRSIHPRGRKPKTKR